MDLLFGIVQGTRDGVGEEGRVGREESEGLVIMDVTMGVCSGHLYPFSFGELRDEAVQIVVQNCSQW